MILLSHTTWQAVMRAMRLVRSEKHDIFTVIIAANSNSIRISSTNQGKSGLPFNASCHMHQECLSMQPSWNREHLR